MFKKFKENILLILVLAIGIFLAVKNYTPGTFLSGWDTLHPEFNFGLAFQREISGVFRTEQGLGAVAAHSHMADLPHVAILYLLNFVFPLASLRYLYIFLCLIAGPIGIYIFLNRYIVKNKIESFLGSLFYLLSLGTMQMFVVPFEMFTIQYAALPWLFLFTTEYLYSGKKSINKLFLFSLTTLLATPMAYAATLWYVYFFIFVSYVACLNLFDRSFSIFKRSVILVLLTLAINSFWIFPNLYFVLNHGKDISGALINQLFSPQAFLYNKEFGNIIDIALMKNFLFDWNAFDGKNNFIPLLSPWINHLKHFYVQLIGLTFAVIALVGTINGYLRKNKILISLLFPLLFCLFFLINDNFPTSFLYNFLGNKVPLFKEAFRFPDDKVLGIFTFVFAIYFAQGQKIILKSLTNKLKITYLIIIISLIGYYALPAFQGNFISPLMRVSIPKDYFAMFDWFKSQDKTARVANLPIHSVYGWEYYKWYNNQPSFQGADFLQFGIPQPLLNRDFDRWSPYNEQYYREMSEAVYNRNPIGFKNILKKYDISYVFLDKNVIAPEQSMNSQILFFPEIENLLIENPDIQQVFNSGNLFVYHVNSQNQQVRVIKNPPSAGPISPVFYEDFAYAKYGNYISYSDPKKNTAFYPFRNLIDNENRILPDVALPTSLSDKQYDIFPSTASTNDCPIQTAKNTKDKMELIERGLVKFLRYSSTSNPICNHYSFPTIPREQGYLITITSRNVSGLPLKLCVANYISKRCDLYAQLSTFSAFTKETFLLPPMEKGVGFNINLNNFSIKGSPAINDLGSINIVPFSYTELSQTEQYNPVNEPKDVSFMTFSQAFNPSWKAYEVKSNKNQRTSWLSNIFPFLFGKELKEHVLVNNWANGWKLNDYNLQPTNYKLVIIFWPQYLEYLGIIILLGGFAWLILSSRRQG